MKTIQEHVDALFREIPDSERKAALKREIVDNLQEKVADLMALGKAEEDAIYRAIVEFGDITDIRDELRGSGTQSAPLSDRSSVGYKLGFSIVGSVLIIALLLFINLYITPSFLWCIFPIFGVLWWPLSLFFKWMKYRR
jgi:hypothetical protein